MASPGPDKDDDDFIRNLLGLSTESQMEVDSNLLADEIRNLDCRLTNGSGDKNSDSFKRHSKSAPSKQKKPSKCVFCEKLFSNSWNLKQHLHLGRCKKTKTTKCSSGSNPSTSKTVDKSSEASKCDFCGKLFSYSWNLKQHLRLGRCKKTKPTKCSTENVSTSEDKREASKCDFCGKSFFNSWNVKQHLRNGRCKRKCCFCSENVSGSDACMASHLQKHVREEYLSIPQLKAIRKQLRLFEVSRKPKRTGNNSRQPSNSHGNGPTSPDESSESDSQADRQEDAVPVYDNQERSSNFDNTLVRFKIRPASEESLDLMNFLANRKQQLADNIKTEMLTMRNVKWYASVTVKMTKYSPEGDIRDRARPSFNSVSQTVISHDDIPAQIDAAIFKICDNLEKFSRDGSGWRLDDILLLVQTVIRYKVIKGSCSDYVLPERLKRKACLLSVVGAPRNSMECFKYAVLAGMFAPPDRTGEMHLSELQQHQNLLDFSGIENAGKRMAITQVRDFEKQNKMSINIFGYIDEPFPLHISRNLDSNTEKHVNLLFVSYSEDDVGHGESDGHYLTIQSLSRFLRNNETMRHGRLYYCLRCLNPKYSEERLQEHMRFCNELQPVRVQTVSEDKKWLEFKNYRRQLPCPFVIVVDIECYRRKLYDNDESVVGKTVRERELEPCAFSYLRISRDDTHPKQPTIYVGQNGSDTMQRFLECMEEEQRDVANILSQKQPIILSEKGLQNLLDSRESCHICSKKFKPSDVVVRDHCHISSELRGFAHKQCNFVYTETKTIPIFCHGLTRFGGKLIMSAVGKYGHKKVSVIPLSVDSYISVMIGNCRYLDSQRFLNGDLKTLVKSAASETGVHCFRYLREFIQGEHVDMFMRTMPLCTEYLDEPARLSERVLPQKEAFFNVMDESDISDEHYNVAQKIWEAMEMRTLRDYLETYLLSNVLLLTDVLVIFRGIMTEHFKLDPFQYFSLSGFSLDVALRESETKLELLTDIEMHTMIESNLRGGLTIVGSPRYAKANNIEMPNQLYEDDKPKSHILFFDVNSMYANVMKKYRLPTFNFKFLTEHEMERFDLMSIEPDSDVGYILECQLEYPEGIHDATDAFGFAPEHIRINPDDLSDYTRDLAEKCGINLERLRDTRKLCLTLNDKDHYVGHYLNVQYYVSKGMILKHIYKIIRFTQSPWLEDLMTKISTKRAEAKSEFYGKVFKSIPNTLYGKLLESVRSYKDVRIVTTPEKLRKLVSLPTFSSLHEFGDNVAAIHLRKETVVVNRLYSVGYCILELAKLEMYKIYYDTLVPMFKDGKCDLLYTDTDSFVIQIHGYEDVNPVLKAHPHVFDFHNLPQDHCLNDQGVNKRKLGCLKLETGRDICCEFVALSPKCYSLLTDNGFKQTLKGSRKTLSHEAYKQCLLQDNCQIGNVREIKSYAQTLYQVSVSRRLLTPLDVKRYYTTAITSSSFGHYKTKAKTGENEDV